MELQDACLQLKLQALWRLRDATGMERETDKGFRAGNQTLQSITEVPGQEIDFIVCLLSGWLPKTPSKDWAIL